MVGVLNRPDFLEALSSESGHHDRGFLTLTIGHLEFHGWNVSYGLEPPPVVEPTHPFQRREFHVFKLAPRSAPAGHLGLVQTDHRLGHGVVVGVAYAAHRRLDARLGQALRVMDRADWDTWR